MNTDTESRVVAWLASRREDMLALLADLVNIDSGTYDKAGVDKVGARIAAFLHSEGIAFETIPNARFGDAIRARIGPEGARTVLLMGHRDTVFPAGEAARRPFTIADGRAYGPGVADMKAGLVMNAFALAALQRHGAPAPVVGLFTSDEEIGSPSSRALIESEARQARAVFNAEPGRPSGAVVTGRKGGVFMRIEIAGKAAHSGASFKDGVSAIEELAHKIIALRALTDLEQGTTVNVGIIAGGQTVNTIAPNAMAEVDLRFVTPADRAAAMAEIEGIVGRSFVSGTSAKLEIAGEFLPLVQTPESKRLFDLYAACSAEIGHPVSGEFTGGCADSGFAAAAGAPTLCATGPIGGRAHSPDEYMQIDSLAPRARTLALSILRLHA